MTELKTIDAIRKRRSIRRYSGQPVPEEAIREIIEAARLAPSGCNAQPWRFKVVTDRRQKVEITYAAHRQQFIARAPVVIVCCAHIESYINSTVSTMQDLGRMGSIDKDSARIICDSAEGMRTMSIEEIGPTVAINVGIAVEHMVLRALDFGLGTCWIRLLDEKRIKKIFGWGDELHVVNLLTVGYPAIELGPQKRLPLEDLLL